MTFVIAIIITIGAIAVGWSIAPNTREYLDNKINIGKDQIDTVMYRLLESPEYTVRSYSGRLDVLKNETRVLLEPLYKNLTDDECKYVSRGLGYHISRRAKLTHYIH